MNRQSMNKPSIEHYWRQYLEALTSSEQINPNYLVEQFGDTPELANELGQLVLDGVKTATCCALWEWQAEHSALPEVGLHTVVLDGNQTPICIIKTTAVEVKVFSEIDEPMAFAEGEGDRTLASWQRDHWQYFSRVLPKIGQEPSLDMLLIYERFQMVYQPQA